MPWKFLTSVSYGEGMTSVRLGVVFPFILGALLAGCSGSNKCSKACKALEQCAGAPACTLGAACGPADECRARCILDATCDAYTGADPAQAQLYQACLSACGSAPPGDGGAADTGPGTDGPKPDACQPDCAGRECGDDGCGGTCGTCSGSLICNTNLGKCVTTCTASCAGKVCGDDGCGGSCGTCPSPQTCNSAGQCECQPDCAGKTCGDDGCGGSCGTCLSFQTCSSGQCVNGGGCGSLTNEGCCDGETLYYCNGTTPATINCLNNPSCGWLSSDNIYDCGTSGGADPGGVHPKACQ